jgi:ketosteroid isomerase-like protein
MTEESTKPADVVRRMYEAFEARDETRLRQLIASEVEWNQCEGLPGGARRQGLDSVLSAVFAANRSIWTGFAAPVETILSDGDRVVALGQYAGVHGETGKPMRAAFAHVYLVRDGQIVQYDQIADTWPMVDAATL